MAAPTVSANTNGVFSRTTSTTIGYTSSLGANGLLVLMLNSTPSNTATSPVVSTVTDTSGNTWHKYAASSFTATADGSIPASAFDDLEIWYTYGTIPASGTLTVTMSASIDAASWVLMQIAGANSTPFDGHAGLPTTFSTTASAAVSMSLSTSTANILVISVTGTPSHPASVATLDVKFGGVVADGSGGVGDFGGVTDWSFTDACWKAYTSKQTNLAILGNNAFTDQIAMAFAVTADVAPPTTPPLNSAYFVG